MALVELPEHVVKAHRASQERVQFLAKLFVELSHEERGPAQTNLLDLFPDSILYIESGPMKYLEDGRLVRFYHGDIFLGHDLTAKGTKLVSEFGGRVYPVPREQFHEALRSQPEMMSHWLEYVLLHSMVLHGLAALTAERDAQPGFELQSFATGDTILEEGQPADEVFVMLSGRAKVTVRRREVGIVESNEFFGETSFLMKVDRRATVTALEPCQVQRLQRDDFEAIIRGRPDVFMALAETLARRISGLNEKLAEMGLPEPPMGAVGPD